MVMGPSCDLCSSTRALDRQKGSKAQAARPPWYHLHRTATANPKAYTLARKPRSCTRRRAATFREPLCFCQAAPVLSRGRPWPLELQNYPRTLPASSVPPSLSGQRRLTSLRQATPSPGRLAGTARLHTVGPPQPSTRVPPTPTLCRGHLRL
ncbi:hypothetical protein OH76DRAFT_724212 [Lentinus brumalis]|uniref:Uncharacterized protein n=1 Tax=Lentinus brumalis TaxID=2498619 RepID=A0A371D519_9APHY|nr:hypothetical protein OH76DRAFT_724212 [Polyporus brumalis]